MLVSKIKELGIKKVVEDSSGNAGAAIAAYCAKAHIDCHIYVPEKTSLEKLTQIERYGAHLHKIPGTERMPQKQHCTKHKQRITQVTIGIPIFSMEQKHLSLK